MNFSSKISFDPTSPSHLNCKPLDCENLKKIIAFKTLLQSCYGSLGKLKMIQNFCGGHVSVTSSSGRLLNNISIINPFLKLITEAIKGHLSTCNDAGLFLGILCCELIEAGLKSELPKSYLLQMNEYILKLCLDHVKSSDCVCKIELNINKSEHLLTLVQNILKTKSSCCLSQLEIKSFSCTLLQAYLSTISQNSVNSWGSHNVLFLTVEGKSVFESKLYSGILFEVSQRSTYEVIWFKNKHIHKDVKNYKVVLFDISLAGDFNNYTDCHYEITSGVSFQNIIVSKILKLAQHLIDSNVHIVLCQKVIHPRIKKFMCNHHILVIDRLSCQNIRFFQTLTGAVSISSFSKKLSDCKESIMPIPESYYGYVDDVNIINLHDKSFVHFISANNSICTLVLCNRFEESLDELKIVCKNILHCLDLAMVKPELLIGGGCFEAYLTKFLQQQLKMDMTKIISMFHCSKIQVIEAGNIFASVLKAVAKTLHPNSHEIVIDSHEWHLWRMNGSIVNDTCSCKLLKRNDLDPDVRWQLLQEVEWLQHDKIFLKRKELQIDNSSVVDLFYVKVNALKVAVEIANLILSCDIYIQDSN